LQYQNIFDTIVIVKKICILASGGDAPGMNACMEAVFFKGKELGYEVWVAVSGYDGLIKDEFVLMTAENSCGISQKSGCVFKCSRSARFVTTEGFAKALANFKKHDFEAMIVLGGNGSFYGMGRLKNAGLPVIGIPATIDNDVFFTKHNLGFSSACENAVQMIDILKETMETNDRDHIVQLMGRHCSELTNTVGTATFADIIDVEENRHTPEAVAEIFKKKRRYGKTSCFMIMQEKRYADPATEAIGGAEYLKHLWVASGDSNIRMNTLGHLQRGARPSCRDRYLGVVYGHAAVDCVINKHFGVGIGITNDQISYTEIELSPVP
jgi:6-phosphofructokinase 1